MQMGNEEDQKYMDNEVMPEIKEENS